MLIIFFCKIINFILFNLILYLILKLIILKIDFYICYFDYFYCNFVILVIEFNEDKFLLIVISLVFIYYCLIFIIFRYCRRYVRFGINMFFVGEKVMCILD